MMRSMVMTIPSPWMSCLSTRVAKTEIKMDVESLDSKPTSLGNSRSYDTFEVSNGILIVGGRVESVGAGRANLSCPRAT